jgi:hypothetical protein
VQLFLFQAPDHPEDRHLSIGVWSDGMDEPRRRKVEYFAEFLNKITN